MRKRVFEGGRIALGRLQGRGSEHRVHIRCGVCMIPVEERGAELHEGGLVFVFVPRGDGAGAAGYGWVGEVGEIGEDEEIAEGAADDFLAGWLWG